MAALIPQGKQPTAGKLTENRYFAALVLVANVISIPILAGLITVLLFATFPVERSGTEWWNVLFALFITLLIWIVLTLLFASFTTIENANRLSNGHLKNMRKELKDQLKIIDDQLKAEEGSKPIPDYKKIALSQVEDALSNVDEMFERKGLLWASAEGYLAAWQEIHAAESAMVMLLPEVTVIINAEYDLSRLQGSSIPGCPDLRDRVQQAIDTLNATDTNNSVSASQKGGDSTLQTDLAQAMFALLKRSLVPSDQSQNEAQIAPDADESQLVQDPDVKASFAQAMLDLMKNGINPTVPAPEQSELEARIDLSQIRSEINQYSDDRWAKLVRYRKNLMVTAALTGFFTYVLLCIPILLKANLSTIIAVTAIYFVGAIIGLFSRLNSEWGDNNTTIDDYGLTLARILVSPLLSGLAAVGGVLLVSLLALTLLSSSGSGGGTSSGGTGGTTPVAVSTVTSAGVTVQVTITQQTNTEQGLPTLQKIFDLQNNLTALVFAAVFGYLPSLLINVLQQQANNWQSQIQSNSQASQGSQGSSNSNSSSDSNSSSGSTASKSGSATNDGAVKAVG
jgi:hypothetical protein